MQYIYHYYVITPQRDGSIDHSYGNLLRSEVISDSTSYAEARKEIFQACKTKVEKAVLVNLALLNPPQP